MSLLLVTFLMVLNANAAVDDRVRELERKVNVLTKEISELKLGETPTDEKVIKTGLGPAASKIYAKSSGVSIGGYGEMVYNNYHHQKDDGSLGSTDKLDLYRNIIYVGYKFNENMLFNTEIEIEHANTGISGAGPYVAVEFAYLDFLLDPKLNVRTGMMLTPMGFINEIHEPPTFWSAGRPYVERTIIPSTWSVNGVGIFGELLDGLDYKLYLVEGLSSVTANTGVTGFSSGGIRNGRQKGANAIAENFALTARLDYEFMPGSLIGASIFSGGTTQGKVAGANGQFTMIDLHSRIQMGQLEIKGVYVESTLGDADLINTAKGTTGTASVGSKQIGSYLEIGYDVLPFLFKGTEQALIPFVRFESLNTQAEVPSNGTISPANSSTYTIYGMSYLPISNISLKLTYENETKGDGKGQDLISFASGYLF